MPSFTTQVPNLREMGPVVQVRLAIGSALEDFLKKTNQSLPPPIQVPAMIEAGATGTVVREDIVTQLNLHPIGVTLINTPSSTNVQCYEYLYEASVPK